jgi:cyclopropane fatty-acyl-phospholipid synthase-like methyltransferase
MIWDLDNSLAMHYGFFDGTTKSFKDALRRENEVVAETLKLKQTDYILDAGCGVGGTSIFLAKKYGCRVVGITLSQKQVEIAYKNAEDNGVSSLVEFRVMDFENMDFNNNVFDIVFGLESVCHANSKEKFIKEAFRVLKNKGKILVADGFASKDYSQEENILMQKWLYGWGVNFLEKVDNFNLYLKNSGFLNIDFRDITENIKPSSVRLYKYSIFGIVISKILDFIGIRSDIQTKNVLSAYYQYKALVDKLWVYGIFYAEKTI